MTLTQVIASGHISYWHFLFTDWWTYLLLLAAIGLFTLAAYIDDRFGVGGFLPFSIAMFSLAGLFTGPGGQQESAVIAWQKNAAYPYINSLPAQHRDIVYMKVQDTSETTGGGGLFTLDISSYDITHVLVLYRDGGTVQKDDLTAELSMRLSPTAQPYLTYQDLPMDLGNGVDAGMYNPVIHLPSNYRFDTIK